MYLVNFLLVAVGLKKVPVKKIVSKGALKFYPDVDNVSPELREKSTEEVVIVH